MRKPQNRLNFSAIGIRTSDTVLPNRARNIIKNMSGNAKYPSPPYTIEAIQKATDKYADSIQEKGYQTTAAKNEKEANKAELVKILQSVGYYVESVAQGDIPLLQTSGFILVERGNATVLPGAGIIKEFKTTATAGTLAIVCASEEFVTLYEAKIELADGRVLYASSARATINFPNLPVGELLLVSLRKQSKLGYGPYGPAYKTRLPEEGEMFPTQPKIRA